MASKPTALTSPGIPHIVARTLRDLPPLTRRKIRMFLLAWLAVVTLRIWDIRDHSGPGGIAELSCVLLGMVGIILLNLALLFRRAVEPAAAGQNRTITGHAQDVGETSARRQILMALPAVGVTAAIALSAATVLLVARVWLGSPAIVLATAVIYCGALVAVIAVVGGAARQLYLHGQTEAARASRVEAHLTEAKLAALQAQMHPHFLFNALNTVAALVRSDPPAAEATVENLSEVLRGTLERSQRPQSTLADEIRFVRAYLAIERQRFGPRLAIEWEIDPRTEAATVPPFCLQPLAENALKHGVGTRREGGRVRIAARVQDNRLHLLVEDDGEGFDARYREDTGLGNLRKRLEVMYGGHASLNVQSTAGGGRVGVELPFVIAGAVHASADR